MYESPDGEYGRMQPDKSWNGAIKELIDGVIMFLVFFYIYIIQKIILNSMNEMIEIIRNEISIQFMKCLILKSNSNSR